MADTNNDKPRTHTAWAIQQMRHRRLSFVRTLEIGEGRIDAEGAHLFLDRLPLGGFSGYVKLLPKGVNPSTAPSTPSRPAQPDDDEDFED